MKICGNTQIWKRIKSGKKNKKNTSHTPSILGANASTSD
jgi:hypothetical protein